jgi:hypothetical protein
MLVGRVAVRDSPRSQESRPRLAGICVCYGHPADACETESRYLSVVARFSITASHGSYGGMALCRAD